MANLYFNATHGHCVICGNRTKMHLCSGCYAEWKDENGDLPPWLSTMRRQADNAAKRKRHPEIAVGLVVTTNILI